MTSADNTFNSKQLKPGKAKAFFVCLVIASFLWLIHSLNTVYNYTLTVPVSFVHLPPGKRPNGGLPKELSVNVKASGLKLLFILINRPFAPIEIDFNNLQSANRGQNFILSSAGIDLKSSLGFETQIKRIVPDTLYFSERTGIQKTVPVKVPLQIRCREGYGYRQPLLEPAFTTIWGDTQLVNETDTLYTQPLILNNLDQDQVSSVAVLKPGHNIFVGLNEVKVAIQTGRLIEQTLQIPVSDLARRPGVKTAIFPSTVKVRFTCLNGDFNPADTSQFRAAINTGKTTVTGRRCPVFITSTPLRVTVMEVNPAEVEFLLIKE